MSVSPTTLAPVGVPERVHALDFLRGIAVLGILVMNVRNFALPLRAFQDPGFPGGETPANVAAWLVGYVLFEDKMISLFSMLFGAGAVLFVARAGARGAPAGALYARRNLILLAIGLVHAYGLWYGDILNTYGACGLLLWFALRRSPRTLLILALLLLLVPLGIQEVRRNRMLAVRAARAAASAPAPAPAPSVFSDEAAEERAYRGSYGDLFLWRARLNTDWHLWGNLRFNLWRCLSLMVLGAAFAKLGVLAAARSDRFYRRLLLAGYGIGLPLVAYAAYEELARRYGWEHVSRFRSHAMLLGSPLVALGHASVAMLLVRGDRIPRARATLAAVGRTALSNYLAQTVLCVLLFDGWALGLWARLGMASLLGVVVAIWAVQIVASVAWVRRFRFGPAEWLWRSFTYGRAQPMRLRA